MWRSRLINSSNLRSWTFRTAKGCNFNFCAEKRMKNVIKYFLYWSLDLVLEERCVCRDSSRWLLTVKEIVTRVMALRFVLARDAVCLYLMLSGGACSLQQRNKKRPRLTIEKNSSHHKFIWMRKRCIHPLLTVMFPLVDDLPEVFSPLASQVKGLTAAIHCLSGRESFIKRFSLFVCNSTD